MDDEGRDRSDFDLEPLDIVNAATFEGAPVPKRRWIWPAWIPVGSVTALYGDGGTGKSLLALQFIMACAAGQTFLGEEVTPCRTLGVFCEDEVGEIHRRLDALNNALSIGFGDLENLDVLSRVGKENILMTFAADGRGAPTPFFSQILARAKQSGARVVVIDTAADTFAGNENVRPQVRQFISLLTRLAIEIDGAVILLAHPSQLGKTTGSGEGGSTAWNNSVRSRLYLSRPGTPEEPGDPNARILSRVKSNYAAIGEAIEFRYEDGAFVRTSDAAPGEAGDAATRVRDVERALIAGLQELAAKGMRTNIHKGQANFAPKALREKTNACARFSEAELTSAMNKLIREGGVASVKEGPPTRERSFLRVMAPDLPGLP